jgi:tripartite-type tricarboxylate transporter receptor subunit TctC
MPVRRLCTIAALAGAFGLVASAAVTQPSYSAAPIRLIIPLAPGGAPDQTAFETWLGMLAPRGTPAEIVRKLNTELAAIVRTPEFAKEYLISKGFEPVGDTSEAFAKFIVEDQKKGKLLVDISGAKLEQ